MNLLYDCNKCGKGGVKYEDWLPIVPGVHWCRACVKIHFDELPESEKERARRWVWRWWENATTEERKAYFSETKPVV